MAAFVFVVIAGILLLAAGGFIKAYWSGFATELGAATARALAVRRRRHRALRSALQTARAGGAPARILAVGRAQGSDVIEHVLSRVDRPPAVAALTTAISASSGPFAGKTPVIVGVGRNSMPLLRAARADPRLKGAPATFAVGVDAEGYELGIEHASGDLWSQCDAAMEWAATALSRGVGDFIAVLLDTPVTGSWSDDKDLDLSRLFETIFRDRSRTTWLTYNEPIDPSAWPDEVIVELQLPVNDAMQAFSAAGLPVLHVKRRVSDRSVVMASADAVALLLMLMSPGPRIIAPAAPPDVAAILPPYSAAITLALEPATRSGTAYVGRDLTIARDVEELLLATGVRISTLDYDTLLPLSIYRGQVTAWLVASPMHVVSSQPGYRPSADTVDDASIQWLLQATASNDNQVAAAVLASHGRAWIEAAPPRPAIEPIKRAMKAFPAHTRAHLWAHYLTALDSALRLNNPSEEWFTQHWCDLADATELGPLFRAERMEFSRLRGELEVACKHATILVTSLRTAATPITPTRAYALGTANFLVANLLRRGGRYDIAREFIDRAVTVLDESVPSHRIELQHCRYATSVCESMQGVATVTSSYEWPSGQAIFGRSLVTLANSHAAWFIADYSRAIEFAEEACRGFESIGYQRYAARADELKTLLANWADRAGSPVAHMTAGGSVPLSELLSAKGEIKMLRPMRPSRALSLLQFAVAFAKQPNAARTIELPTCITLEENGEFTLVTPPDINSFKRAERVLRSVMGIGARTRVPLAAD